MYYIPVRWGEAWYIRNIPYGMHAARCCLAVNWRMNRKHDNATQECVNNTVNNTVLD